MMENNYTQAPWGTNAGYNTGFANGMAYSGTPVQPKMTNPLSPEELKALKQNNAFTLQVTPTEFAEGICTHKDPQTGAFSTVPNPDGTCTCSICHQTINPNKVESTEYVQAVTDDFVNILQTCKLLGVDLSDDVTRGVFQMLPFVKKIPELFKMTQASFIRYNEANPMQNFAANPNPWAMMQQVTMGQPMYQQPMMNQPQPGHAGYQQAPQMYNQQMYQQPMMNQPTPYMNMQSSMVPGGNPFYAQQNAMPANQPMLPTQMPNQQQQAQPNATEEKKDVTVQTQMGL